MSCGGLYRERIQIDNKKSGHYAIQGVLNVLLNANKKLAKDSSAVLMNKGSSIAKISKPSMAHSDVQGTICSKLLIVIVRGKVHKE